MVQKKRFKAYVVQLDHIDYALWTVPLKSTNRLGGGELNVDPFQSGCETEVSTFFHPENWGKDLQLDLYYYPLIMGLPILN